MGDAMTAELVEIYDSEASFSYNLRPPDMTSPVMAFEGATEPVWGVHEWSERRGRRMHMIPHALLEDTVLAHGHDPEDLEGIVSTIMHMSYVPSPDDALVYDDPGAVAVLEATADVPDPRAFGMPDGERLEATLALVAAVRKHRATVDPASRKDRQGALDFRRAVILEAGDAVPEEFRQDLDIVAPEHPLDAILSGVRLDPARIAARRARNDWIQARRERAVSRRTAMIGPRTFGFGRIIPQEPQQPAEAPSIAAARERMRGAK